MTRHVDVVRRDQTVSNMVELAKCSTMFDQMFDFVQILLNTIQDDQTRTPNGKMIEQQTTLDHVFFSSVFLFEFRTLFTKITLLIDRVFPFENGSIHFPENREEPDKISFCARRCFGVKGFFVFAGVVVV